MKDESSAKLTSDSQSGYATSSNSLQVRTSRPSMGMEMSKVEQAPCTPLLSRRPEEGALFLPCDERCINATCSTFPGPRPKQPFPSNNELGGATPCSAYRPTMPTVSRPSQIIALQHAWPATWLSPHPPAVSAGPLLGLASGNRLLPMLAGGGWPGAAGRAAEGSIAPLRSWLSAAAAVFADILSLCPAPQAHPFSLSPAPIVGPGRLGSAGWAFSLPLPALPTAGLPGAGVFPGFWQLPPPPPPQ